MARLGTRKLLVEIDGVEYSAQVSNCRIVGAEADSDFVTFADAAAGGKRDYTLAFTAEQNLDTTSLWSQMWDSAGDTVPVTIMPEGNEEPSVAAPHFQGNVVISEPDGDLLGGEANADPTAAFTFEAEWRFTARPTKITTGGGS